MSLNEEVEILRNIPLFANIEPSKLKLLAFTSERLTFRNGQDLCVQGEMGDAAFIIIRGDVDVLVPTNGGELSVAVLGKGEIFGELAVICDQTRSSAIAARTELETLRLDRNVVLNLMREFPDISVEMVRILGDRLEKTTRELSVARASLAALPDGAA